MKLLKNRIFLAAVCILCGLGAIFLFMRTQSQTTGVVVAAKQISRGEKIKADDLRVITVGGYGLADGFARTPDELEGRYALADFYPSDYILLAKTAETLPSADLSLDKLDGSRVAISVNIKDFAQGVSDKLIAGDIVSCNITEQTGTGETETFIPEALTYVEVLTATTLNHEDRQRDDDTLEENLATVTLLATPEQEVLLAHYNATAGIHLALVYRGDTETADAFLEKQQEILDALPEPDAALPPPVLTPEAAPPPDEE